MSVHFELKMTFFALLHGEHRPQEGVKIAATDEEAKAEAAAPAIVDIDEQANQILRYDCFFAVSFLCAFLSQLVVIAHVFIFLVQEHMFDISSKSDY